MPEKVLPFRSKYIIEGTAKDRGMEKNSKLLNFESISFGNFFLKIDAKPFINISSRWMILETRNGKIEKKRNQNRWSLEICRLELLKTDVKNIFVRRNIHILIE